MSEKFTDWMASYQINPSPLIHVGAHLVQEREMYRLGGCEPVLWVEAQPTIFNQAQELLKSYGRQFIVNTVLWSKSKVEMNLYIAGNEGSSSSLLEPFLISASHPQVVTHEKYKIETTTLDDLLTSEENSQIYKVLVLDVQGAELEVLRGAKKTLKNIDVIISEVSILELYKGTARLDNLVKYLSDENFAFVASEINRATGWGEGLFIRKSSEILSKPYKENHIVIGKRIALGRLSRTIKIRMRKLFAQDLRN